MAFSATGLKTIQLPQVTKTSFLGTPLRLQHLCQRVRSLNVGPVRAGNPFRPGKKWLHLPTNKNGKVIKPSLHVKKGDFVQVIAGNDKGKTGEIIQVAPKYGLVKVAGVNIKTKHNKPTSEEEPGSVTKAEAPIHSSNVMLFSKDQNVRSRVGHKFLEDGKKVRYLLKTGEVLP